MTKTKFLGMALFSLLVALSANASSLECSTRCASQHR